MSGVAENDWCTCEPKVVINGKEYPPAAKFQMPGAALLGNIFGTGDKTPEVTKDGTSKNEL